VESVWKGTNVNEAHPLPQKNRERTKKRLAILWRRKKITNITKRQRLVVGKEKSPEPGQKRRIPKALVRKSF
jgi:hypothetical protein